MTFARNLVLAIVLTVPTWAAAAGTSASPASSGHTEWPTYSGDYSGQRHSPLTQVNRSNVKNLTLAWVSRLTSGMAASGDGVLSPAGPPTIVGGEIEEAVVMGGLFPSSGPASVRGAILQVDGVLYVSSPDNAWAIDARTGSVIWHYYWKTKGGTHTANKGLGIHKNTVFMETADDYLIALDARTGSEKWHEPIANFSEQYFSEAAPIVIGDRVLVGTGNDLDMPGSLRSYDAESGELQWTFETVPTKEGDPGLDTWPNLEAARHGGGNVWAAGSYDPESHLYIFGTGNPAPAYSSAAREGDNLFTCTLIAVNVDTGKMAWYYQTSPHDTHDWDSAQTPVLVDAEFGGQPRKLVMQATRNGHFFVLDRVSGQHLLTSRFLQWGDWTLGLNKKGQPVRNPKKDPAVGGTLTSMNGWSNWPPPAYNPDAGLFYLRDLEAPGLMYFTESDPRRAMGLGGMARGGSMSFGSTLMAIDYKTGRIAWQRPFEPGAGLLGALGTGLLSTAGGLVFTSDNGENLVAFNSHNGEPLWHSRLHGVSNAPETYLLDGHQYVLVAAGDTIYAFTLY
jgi:alcohol dehydrogenase (cytochrome c)